MEAADEFAGRYPGTTGLLRYFEYGHLPGHLQTVSSPSRELARTMARALPDGPELTAGLRKLLEAKDCFLSEKQLKQVCLDSYGVKL
jgi:hypothetical protein